jgi:hypothetical protein
MPRHSGRFWLGAAVLAHLAVSVLHGMAHTGAHVPLSPGATVFVYAVILAGPLAGWAVSWAAERTGNWLVAGTMAAALVFGVVNHFMRDSPDQIGHVAPQWRPLFATTAVLLAVIEAAATVLALRNIRGRSL